MGSKKNKANGPFAHWACLLSENDKKASFYDDDLHEQRLALRVAYFMAILVSLKILRNIKIANREEAIDLVANEFNVDRESLISAIFVGISNISREIEKGTNRLIPEFSDHPSKINKRKTLIRMLKFDLLMPHRLDQILDPRNLRKKSEFLTIFDVVFALPGSEYHDLFYIVSPEAYAFWYSSYERAIEYRNLKSGEDKKKKNKFLKEQANRRVFEKSDNREIPPIQIPPVDAPPHHISPEDMETYKRLHQRHCSFMTFNTNEILTAICLMLKKSHEEVRSGLSSGAIVLSSLEEELNKLN